MGSTTSKEKMEKMEKIKEAIDEDKFRANEDKFRAAVVARIPRFLEEHCDLSDHDAYTDADLFVDVFVRFLCKHIADEVRAFHRNYITNEWLTIVFVDEMKGKVAMAGWCEKISWTPYTFPYKSTVVGIVGMKLKNLSGPYMFL